MLSLKALFKLQITKVYIDFPILLGEESDTLEKNSPYFFLLENLETSKNIYKTPHALLTCGAQN